MNKIKELRSEKGITQTELASYLKISARAVGYYENGEREPDYDTLLKIAEYFDVSIDYLLGRVTNPMSNADFHVGLSRKEEGSLSDEEKQQIRDFAKYVISKRNGGN